MAFPDAGAVLRADLNSVVEEAMSADRMFIGEQVMPMFGVAEKDGQYPKFRLAESQLLNDDSTIRTPGGSYGEVRRAYTTDTYGTVDRGLEEAVDDTYRRNVARFYDAEAAAARQVMRQVRIAYEQRVSDAIINASTFTATSADVAYTEANLATINFVLDVLNAIDRLNDKGVMPNTIVLSSPVWNRTRRSTILQNYVRGNRPTDSEKMISPDDVAAVFDLEKVLVGRLSKNSADVGQTYSATKVWPNSHIWVGLVEEGDPMNGGAGRTLVWTEEGGLFTTESYRNENRRSDMIRVRHHTAEKVIDPTAGELITTSYA